MITKPILPTRYFSKRKKRSSKGLL